MPTSVYDIYSFTNLKVKVNIYTSHFHGFVSVKLSGIHNNTHQGDSTAINVSVKLHNYIMYDTM